MPVVGVVAEYALNLAKIVIVDPRAHKYGGAQAPRRVDKWGGVFENALATDLSQRMIIREIVLQVLSMDSRRHGRELGLPHTLGRGPVAA